MNFLHDPAFYGTVVLLAILFGTGFYLLPKYYSPKRSRS